MKNKTIISLLTIQLCLTNILQADLTPICFEKIKQADLYFEATLFDKSIDLYRSLLPKLRLRTKENANVRLKLAKSYYFMKEYDQIPPLFDKINFDSIDPDPEIQTLSLEGMLLAGLAYNQLGKYEEAIKYLVPFLTFARDPLPSLYEQGTFELGYAFYHLKKYNEAKLRFLEIQEERFFPLSQIYLIRLAIRETHHAQGRHLLEVLKKTSQKNHSLLFALPFLEGELLFHEKRWDSAAAFFEQALNNPNPDRSSWKEEALFYLGWCHFHHGENIHSENELMIAESLFQQLLQSCPSEQTFLALLQTLLKQGIDFENSNALEKLNSLVSTNSFLFTSEGKYQALLFKAEASFSYSERKQLFRQLTSSAYQDISLFPQACYLSGLNDLKEGRRLAREGLKYRKHLEEAIKSFHKSFEQLYTSSNKKLASQALIYLAQAYSIQSQREDFIQGLSILNQLLNLYRNDLFPLIEEPGEIYYLQGQMASALIEKKEEDPFFTLAENALVHGIESYPNGRFADASLHLLGILYYQKRNYEKGEELFLNLAQKLPSSSYSKEAWHWAANCAEHKEGVSQKVRQYRKKFFDLYPGSPLAAEAFFRYYSMKDYSQGTQDAIIHLQTMSEKFPSSPYLITAYYLLGLHALKESNHDEALTYFQLSADSFHARLLPDKQKSYFSEVRIRALLEKGSLYTQMKEQEKELDLLATLYQEWNTGSDSRFSNSEQNWLEEESTYRYILSLISLNQEIQAEEILSKMLEKYQSAKITRGYYLSRVWYQKGLLAHKQNQFSFALKYFTHAEDAAKGRILKIDELLDLWIEQSLCYISLEQFEEAMLILSRVINYDAISSLRLKAMFLRAEVYEKQERGELAKRQLEALGKKGGPWAQKAQEELKKRYGYL